ncbi:MAG TPA: formyltransferase family protein, partial [Myxococcota bacterium]
MASSTNGPASPVMSCLLLGEEPLLIRCAEVLRERGGQGWRIVGIVTQAPAIRHWALKNDVPVVERDQYGAVLEREPVDVLFSITHPALIAPTHLSKARIAAINYHDGPLPKYAGMNGSTWALMNGEHKHAVVWHHLTAGLDAGDVLERRDVELHPRETSVSLNMGNSVRALESFKSVVDRISKRDLAGVPQRHDVERTVFSRHDRPAAMCVIDLARPAAEIDRLVRACEFGPYTNRFGAAKLMHGDRAVIVREASVEASLAAPLAAGAGPGTVLSIDDDGIVIAVGSGALRGKRFTALSGAPLTCAQAAAALSLRVGDVAHAPLTRGPDTDALSRQLASAEPRLLAALARRALPSLPFATSSSSSSSPSVPVPLPAPFLARFADRWADAVGALFTFTLSCLVRDDSFDVAYVDAEARGRGALGAARGLLFPSIPLRTDIDVALDFPAHLGKHALALAQAHDAPAFLTDLIARHPSLREQA